MQGHFGHDPEAAYAEHMLYQRQQQQQQQQQHLLPSHQQRIVYHEPHMLPPPHSSASGWGSSYQSFEHLPPDQQRALMMQRQYQQQQYLHEQQLQQQQQQQHHQQQQHVHQQEQSLRQLPQAQTQPETTPPQATQPKPKKPEAKPQAYKVSKKSKKKSKKSKGGKKEKKASRSSSSSAGKKGDTGAARHSKKRSLRDAESESDVRAMTAEEIATEMVALTGGLRDIMGESLLPPCTHSDQGDASECECAFDEPVVPRRPQPIVDALLKVERTLREHDELKAQLAAEDVALETLRSSLVQSISDAQLEPLGNTTLSQWFRQWRTWHTQMLAHIDLLRSRGIDGDEELESSVDELRVQEAHAFAQLSAVLSTEQVKRLHSIQTGDARRVQRAARLVQVRKALLKQSIQFRKQSRLSSKAAAPAPARVDPPLSKRYKRDTMQEDRRVKHSIELTQNVHFGYACDGCGFEPIVGVRFTCKACDELGPDFAIDLCERCRDSPFAFTIGDQHTGRGPHKRYIAVREVSEPYWVIEAREAAAKAAAEEARLAEEERIQEQQNRQMAIKFHEEQNLRRSMRQRVKSVRELEHEAELEKIRRRLRQSGVAPKDLEALAEEELRRRKQEAALKAAAKLQEANEEPLPISARLAEKRERENEEAASRALYTEEPVLLQLGFDGASVQHLEMRGLQRLTSEERALVAQAEREQRLQEMAEANKRKNRRRSEPGTNLAVAIRAAVVEPEEEEEEEEFAAPDRSVDPELGLSLIRKMPELALVIQLIDLFRSQLSLGDFDCEVLESMLTKPVGYEFLAELHVKLLNFVCTRRCNLDNWEDLFRAKLEEEKKLLNTPFVGKGLPLGARAERIPYSNMHVMDKVSMLCELLHWQFDYNERLQNYLEGLEPAQINDMLREEPVGTDGKDVFYYSLDYNDLTPRVYVEDDRQPLVDPWLEHRTIDQDRTTESESKVATKASADGSNITSEGNKIQEASVSRKSRPENLNSTSAPGADLDLSGTDSKPIVAEVDSLSDDIDDLGPLSKCAWECRGLPYDSPRKFELVCATVSELESFTESLSGDKRPAPIKRFYKYAREHLLEPAQAAERAKAERDRARSRLRKRDGLDYSNMLEGGRARRSRVDLSFIYE